MRWSSTGNFTNTCPADTAMTPFVDHVVYNDPGLMHDFKKTKKLSATDKDFVNACGKVTEGTRESIDKGHDIFADIFHHSRASNFRKTQSLCLSIFSDSTLIFSNCGLSLKLYIGLLKADK